MSEIDIFGDAGSIERPLFFNGQQLYASDLDGVVAFHRALRWEHNRSLHQPGVGNGFAVAGRRGDRQVSVQPGYALDAEGREILLLDTHVEPVPPVAADPDGRAVCFDLTVSYPSDDDLEEAETRAGVCLPRGVVRRRERPVFCWVRLRRDVNDELRPQSPQDALDIQNAVQIVLARAEVLNCVLDADISVTHRRTARPQPPPHIACGCSPVTWEPWTLDDPDEEPVGILARVVDTRSGGFRVTPCYQARVVGPRPLEATTGGLESSETLLALDIAAYVQAPTPTAFECRVPVIAIRAEFASGDVDAIVAAAQETWPCVLWMGVGD